MTTAARRRPWSFPLSIPAAAAVLLLPFPPRPTTYYVSPSGNDGNNGTSQTTPWKTAARVNAAAFAPGDRILFQRGGTWRESLNASSSGEAGKPIIYADYGAGAKPTFYGSDVLPNRGFAAAGNGVYRHAVPGLPNARTWAFVLQDHAFLGGGPAAYSDPNLDIASTTDPRTDGRLYTVCRRGNVVHSNRKNHLVFRNLIADETAASPDNATQGYGMRAEGSVDVLFENCEALRCGRHNFGCINSDQVVFRGCRAAYVAPKVDGGNSLYVSYSDAGFPGPTCSSAYENCSADHQEKVDGGIWDFIDTHSQNGKALLMTMKNPSPSGGKLFITSDRGGKFTMTGGTLTGGRIELFLDGCVIDGVTFKGTALLDCYSSANVFQNCIFDNVAPTETACFLFRDAAKDNTVRFNTIKAAGGACLGFYGAAPGLKAYGNIMIGTPTFQGRAADAAYVDGNLYGAPPGTVMGQAWVAWTGSGKDARSKTGDPRFVNPAAGDFSLQSGSPAIDAAGTAQPAPDHDFSGAKRPQGAGPDIGACEARPGRGQ